LKRLLDPFLDLLLLRAGPQHLPASPLLLAGAVAAAAISSLLLANETFAPGVAVGRTALDLGLTALLLFALLHYNGLADRFRQSFTAACGTGAILALLTWPLFRLVMAGGEGDGSAVAAMVGVLLIVGWNIVVLGHILRHALDTGLGRGIALALVYLLILTLIGEWLMPAAETA